MHAVIELAAHLAKGLDFAGIQDFVNRNIKPKNIRYEPGLDTVSITAFGIALITESSKTKTGLVLGTPSFTSPGQLAGKQFDDRSGLFSLGVMFYQMLSGSLPSKQVLWRV